MARSPAVALALCVLLVAAGLPAGVGAAASPSAFDLGQQFDRTQFHVTVFENGSARWTFHYERTLANETERERFEAFAASFNANETTLYSDFRNQSETLARNGRATTGREMDARSFDRRAFVTTQLNDIGVVELSFTWVGFARLDGERVVVGDVFEGGLYVGPAQSLVFRAGEGLAFRDVEPAGTLSGASLPESDTVTWQGERTFADNHPHVVLSPADAGGSGNGAGGQGDDGLGGESGSTLWPVGLVLLVVAGAVGAFLYRRRASGAAGSADGRGAEAAAADDPAVGDEALLGDEERVDGLLREHGGRMRQSAIVEETGWSKSKVSMVLSEMEEDDQVSKLRVGRENIVSLPGHEPSATRSPHDEPE